MYPEDDHFHYTPDEIRERFKEYIRSWRVNPEEHGQLCKILSCLDTEQVRILRDEIHTVVFGEQKEKDNQDKEIRACYLNLREEGYKAMRGIIFVAPDFSNPHWTLKKLFHELAHHMLDHRHEGDQEVVAKNEAEADKLAWEWFLREHPHLMD